MQQNLRTIQLVVNNNCNCFCKMCDVGVLRRQKHQKSCGLASEEAQKLTQKLKTNFVSNIFAHDESTPPLSIEEYRKLIQSVDPGTTFYINSAEPLLYKNIFPLLEILCEHGMRVYMTTNGLLLNKYVEKIAEYPIENFCVSIDGPAAVHDDVRGIKGLFAKAFEGMSRLRELRPDLYLRTSTAISHMNQDSLLSMAKALEPLGLQAMLVNHLNFIDQDMSTVHNQHYGELVSCTPSSITLTPPHLVHVPRLAREVFELKQRYANVCFYPDISEPEELYFYYKYPLSSVCGYGCLVGTNSLAVAPNGDIQLGQRCFQHVLGNVRDSSLRDTLNNNPWLQTFRTSLKEAGGYFPACTRCCGGFNGKLRQRAFAWSGACNT